VEGQKWRLGGEVGERKEEIKRGSIGRVTQRVTKCKFDSGDGLGG